MGEQFTCWPQELKDVRGKTMQMQEEGVEDAPGDAGEAQGEDEDQDAFAAGARSVVYEPQEEIAGGGAIVPTGAPMMFIPPDANTTSNGPGSQRRPGPDSFQLVDVWA